MILVYLISLIMIIISLMVNAKTFQDQYYSITRYFKVVLTKLSNEIFKLLLFITLGVLIYHFYSENLGLILIILSYIFLITEYKLKDYHFTRRYTFLLVISVVISVILYYLLLSLTSAFIVVLSLFFITNIGLILGEILLMPIEDGIRNYYIKRARNKILKNNYYIIGITGSFGKTSMKNILYSLLKSKYKISFQNHNYNTVLGLSKYINDVCKDDDEILILELGVDKINSMKEFKKLFTLDKAIITSIGNMHLATFKTYENIKKEKLKIIDLLKESGKLYINKSLFNENIEYENTNYLTNDLFEIINDHPYTIKYLNKVVQLPFYFDYQISYLSIAIKIAKDLNVEDKDILISLMSIELPSRRFTIKKIRNDIIIDNSYNSNYEGFKKSIDVLSKFDNYKILITGGLIELGDKYEEINFKIGEYLECIDLLILVTKDQNHPLKRGYLSIHNKKIKQIDNIEKIDEILLSIKKDKVVLYNSIGNDVFLK